MRPGRVASDVEQQVDRQLCGDPEHCSHSACRETTTLAELEVASELRSGDIPHLAASTETVVLCLAAGVVE